MPDISISIATVVRGTYDLQALRLQAGGRLVAAFKAKLGQQPSRPESDLEDDEQETLDMIRDSYRRLTDGIAEQAEATETKRKRPAKDAKFPTKDEFPQRVAAEVAAKHQPLITSFAELCLVRQYIELEKQESAQFKILGGVLEDDPIYAQYLSTIKGVGPAMAGVLIAEIDLTKARYVSSLWAYSGYDVASDGRGRSRRKEHLTTYQYKAKDGTEKERVGITYNPTLKTKLYVLATCLLRSGNETYRPVYDGYKHRMENHEKYGAQNDGKKDENGYFITSKARRHAMAIRYVIKRFLADYYVAGKRILGLPAEPEYSVAKLGRPPHGGFGAAS